MLIKLADDKSKRQALLEDLQKSSLLDARQKEWLRDELRRCKTGMDGEPAAYLQHLKTRVLDRFIHSPGEATR